MKSKMSDEQAISILKRVHTGILSTINSDGSPYPVPVHFVYMNGKIYIHGKYNGQKTDNILRDGRVGFTAYETFGYVTQPGDNPCRTNTKYESVIISGIAVPVSETGLKVDALTEIVRKYTPQMAVKTLPEAAVCKTAVIEITITEMSGKYYN